MKWEAVKNFLMGQGIYYIMAGIGVLGLVCILIQYVAVRLLSGKAARPGQCENGYIKRLCQEFERQLKCNGNVNNVNNFVDNYLSINKFGFVSLTSLDWFCGQLVYLCLLCGIIFGGLGYILKVEMRQCLSILLSGAGIFGVLFCLRKISNCGARIKKAELNLSAYLENDVMIGILGVQKRNEKGGQAPVNEEKKKAARKRRAKELEESKAKEAENGENREKGMEEKMKEKAIVDMAKKIEGDAAGKTEWGAAEKTEGGTAGKTEGDAAKEPESDVSKKIEEDAAKKAERDILKEEEADRTFGGKGAYGKFRPENQASRLVKINEVREFAQKTMEKPVEERQGNALTKGKETEAGRETAAALIYPLERESTRETSRHLTQKDEEIIADILKEYAK